MKKLLIIALILLLVGCNIDKNVIFNDIDTVLNTYQKGDYAHQTNNNTKYFSYYLPSDVNEIEYGTSFNHLVFNSSDFIMSLNINAVLSENIFNSNADDPYSFLEDFAIYNSPTSNKEIKFSLYDTNDDLLFSFYSDKLSIFGSTTYSDAKELVNHLLMINDSISINTKNVIADYYTGTAIDYTQETVNLFDTYHPLNGDVKDLLPN